MPNADLIERPLGPCREYQGKRLPPGGYGNPRLGGKRVLLHRWVVEQVEGPLQPGEIVMHLCDNPPCFRYSHLRRATQSANIQDAMAKGRHRYVAHPGEANGGGGKLTEADVRAIRQRYRAGRRPWRRELAAEYGVSVSAIEKILNRTLWKHVQ